jgi:transposase-like protein
LRNLQYPMKKKRAPQHKVGENKSPIVAAIPAACADEGKAASLLEWLRWGDTPCCVKCGSTGVYKMTDRKTGERSKRFLWRCRDCAEIFTVRSGTVMAESRIPMRHWTYAYWACCAGKKGVAAKQIQRQTGLSYKSALFLLHRVRHAMANGPTPGPKLSGIVEADETYVGGKPRYRGQSKRGRGTKKTPVVAIVERGGSVRADVVQSVDAKNLRKMILEHVEPGTSIYTDDLNVYPGAIQRHGPHRHVKHSAGEYVNRDDPTLHTNTAEGFFSLFKRSMYGIYHAVSKKHLPRYVHEAEFRYNTRKLDDGGRVEQLVRGSVGKRLMYREPIGKVA